MPRVKKEFPLIVEGYNSTAKNAWWNAKVVHPTSRKKAIRSFCLLCMGGGVKDIKGCTSPDCPLFSFRITG